MNEWDNEPDFLDWTHNGFNCRVQRQTRSKALNGYVQIPAGHPLYECGYSDALPAVVSALSDEVMNGPVGKRSSIQIFTMCGDKARAGDQFDVHGGVTYSGAGYWLAKDADRGFWYGFDCSHCDDLCPGYDYTNDGEYRNLAYVKSECERLADQLAHVREIAAA